MTQSPAKARRVAILERLKVLREDIEGFPITRDVALSLTKLDECVHWLKAAKFKKGDH